MDKWAVMGSPIAHSLSPRLHQAFARATGIALHYEARAVEPCDLAATLEALQQAGFRGCHLTAPLKRVAFTLCEPDAAATLAQSVNCITFNTSGLRHGHNYDGIGLVSDLYQHNIALQDARIAILGAGGAVRGILGPLLACQPREVVLINRTLSTAAQLAEHFRGLGTVHCSPRTQTLHDCFDLVIHASSEALHEHALFTLPFTDLTHSVCYDLSYGTAAQPFLHAARALGATRLMDGFGMLVAQAAENFQRCYGVCPPICGLTAAAL